MNIHEDSHSAAVCDCETRQPVILSTRLPAVSCRDVSEARQCLPKPGGPHVRNHVRQPMQDVTRGFKDVSNLQRKRGRQIVMTKVVIKFNWLEFMCKARIAIQVKMYECIFIFILCIHFSIELCRFHSAICSAVFIETDT